MVDLSLFPLPPRTIGLQDAAFVADVPYDRARAWHEIGLPAAAAHDEHGEPFFGHREVVTLMWLARMNHMGVTDTEIHTATTALGAAGTTPTAVATALPDILDHRPDDTASDLADRLRTMGPLALLPTPVADRLTHLGPDGLRPADLEDLLVTDSLQGTALAFVRSDIPLTLAADPALRAGAEEIEAAEAALDLLEDPEHPDVTATARLMAHHTEALAQATARLGLDTEVEAYLDAACASAPEKTEAQRQAENERDAERTTKMPYPFSAARWRAHVLSFTTTD